MIISTIRVRVKVTVGVGAGVRVRVRFGLVVLGSHMLQVVRAAELG
jgi:hypothetical protein